MIARLPQDVRLEIGKLGTLKFQSGNYAYVGSALGNLEKRVERHLGNEKSKHWHIDYLLDEAHVIDVIYGETSQKKECIVAEALSKYFPCVPGFGSSDCKCDSHLFYERGWKIEEKVISSFERTGLNPKRWKIG